MRGILDKAEGEGNRDLTAEEAQEFDRFEGEFDGLERSIQRLERDAGLDPILSRGAAFSEDREVPEPRTVDALEAFTAFLRAKGDVGALSAELRAPLQVSPNNQGGFTVPQEWSGKLIEVARQFGVVESLADSITTDNGNTYHIAGVVDPSTMSAAAIAESGSFTESEDTFNEVTLGAYKYGHVVKVSDELLNDSQFDINGFVQRRAAQAITLMVNPKLVTGAGSTEPQGITNNTAGVTLATGQTTTISSADSLIDLYHSVPVPYRNGAVWILHDTTLKIVRKFKDSTNQYIWQPGLVAGAPDTLLGKPVYIDPDMPVPAANAKSIFFGDVRENYLVRSVTPVNLKILNELYAGNGQVGFRIDRRLDGKIQNPAAARLLVHSAT